MKKLMLIIVAALGLSLAFQNQVYAQMKGGAKKKVMVYGKSGSGGKDLTVPSEDKPREKSKKRGTCYLYLDNYTGYYVDVWVENQYQGRLSPYATSVRFDVWTPGDFTHWYAKSAGGTYYWSNDSYCNDSRVFTINLKQ